VFQGEQFACLICAEIAFEVKQISKRQPDEDLAHVAAAEGWKDITTLIDCYQQPDEETLRSVVEFVRLTH
jgi:hypothetical protein